MLTLAAMICGEDGDVARVLVCGMKRWERRKNFFEKSVNSNIKMSFSDTLGKCQNK